MIERLLGLDVSAAFADYKRQLAFEIEIVGHGRPDHFALVAD